MKPVTIAHYKIFEFIEKNFYTDNLTLEEIDKDTIKIIDHVGDELLVKYIDGEVVTE